MHLYVMVRGINDAVQRWENDVSAIYLPIKAKIGAIGKVENCRVRTAVRPIQLYEIVFPEEQLNTILETIPETGTTHPWMKKILPFFRKLMGVSKPEIRKHNGAVVAPHIAISYIGLKKDARDEDGCELL